MEAGGGREGFTIILLLFSDYLGHVCPRRHCVFTSYLKWQWAYKLGTFPSPKNTMVKEPFMKKIFDVCQPEDPNGGIDIFLKFFTLKLF